ncbi:MAG: ComF family protein [Deltaproteobacteria bacterium]|nr:ComF family protein [Deltaproteobacteria bacterium]
MLKAFLNLLLPQICPLCAEDADDGRFCQRCFAGIRLITGPICPCCGMPFVSQENTEHLCGRCIIKEPPFEAARSAGVYKGVLLEAIHRFKYNGKTSLAKPLIKIIADMFPANACGLIVPVPLHKTRLKERGFNQSLLLAKGLAKIYNLPIDYLNLKRIRATDHQANLKGKDRLTNVMGAFAVQDKAAFQDKKILLIDDVYTTGATITECSKVLKKAGAKGIDVLTLARVADL